MSDAATRSFWRRPIVAAATALPVAVAIFLGGYLWWQSRHVTIGVEGRREVEIAGPRLEAAPFTPGDAVSLRVADVVDTPGGFRYDLRYIVYGPGTHDLAAHLRRVDGGPLGPLPKLSATVDSILPARHGGELFAAPTTAINLHSSYSATMRVLWLLWGLLLVPLLLYGRRKRRASERPVPPPTVVERLRVLLERAAVEHLPPAEQAEVEQLLMAYWSDRLNLAGERFSDAVERLRHDPTAGRQLVGVERWLHAPSTPANGEIARELLRELMASSPAEFRGPRGDQPFAERRR